MSPGCSYPARPLDVTVKLRIADGCVCYGSSSSCTVSGCDWPKQLCVTASEFIFKLENKFLVSLPCCKTGEQAGSVCCVFRGSHYGFIEQVDHHLCRINLTAV